MSMRTRILLRFLGFFQSLISSPSKEVRTAARLSARDLRRTLGSDLSVLKSATGVDPWRTEKSVIRRKLMETERVPVGETDVWRVNFLQKLIVGRLEARNSNNRNEEERLQSLINSLVVN